MQQSQSEEPAAEEVLVFTYNHDLAFFERSALGLLQQTGARISIVADARVAHHDLYAVRRAGIAYLPGMAWCPGAFHPKLLLIAGPRRVTIAVGSGNLSLAGWQGNDELWTIHHADNEHHLSVVGGVAAWLRALPGSVTLSEGVSAALERSARLLDPLAGSDGVARFVHSLHAPIIDQLPTGPVDELNLYAPFHDPGAEAVAALVKRFEPKHLTISVQPTLTRIDGPATARHLGGGGELVTIPDYPYRHGKLIEWAQGGHRWALTGSPNLSRAALLRPTRAGGNVEIGIIAPVDSSLMPEGALAPPGTAEALQYRRQEWTRPPRVVVLGAVRTVDGLSVQLARPLEEAGTVEASPLGASPDHWIAIGVVRPEESGALLSEDLAGGSRVRLRLADGSSSSVVFVVDPDRVLRSRTIGVSGGRPAPPLDKVLIDPRAAEQLVRVAGELRQNLGQRAHAPHGPGGAGGGGSTFSVGDWEDYLDRCRGNVGEGTLAFALGIPIPHRGGRPVIDINWDDETIDDDESGGLDDDSPEDDVEDVGVSTSVPSDYQIVTAARARYRKVADSLIHSPPGADPVERLLALRLTLVLVAGGAWPSGDNSWVELVLDGVANLASTEFGSEYEDTAGSLAALALSVASASLSHGNRTVAHIRFEQTVDRVAHLLVAAMPERIATYAEGLERSFVAHSDPYIVLDLHDRLLDKDPIADAVADLFERGIDAVANGVVITLTKQVSQPLLPAWAALALAEQADLVAIHSCGTKGWARVLWHSPDLVAIQPGAKERTVSCRHYIYPRGTSPSADIRIEGRPDRPATQTLAGQPLPQIAIDLLSAVGMDSDGF